MKTERILLFFAVILLCGSFFTNARISADETRKLYLKRAIGDLEVYGVSTDSTYEAYFHIPIAFGNQVPIFLEVKSSDLIDYRFIHLNAPNLLIAARLKRSSGITELNWNAWVIIKEKKRTDLPVNIPIPTMEQLPGWTKKWLTPTACVQIDEPEIIDIAQQVRGNTSNILDLASNIHQYCARNIPFSFAREPFTLDAFYALNWGSSCTGHSHAASALFRANGIPSRNLMNILTWVEGPFDMHWFNDYYVPDYGWVQMDPTSLFMFNCLPQDAVIIHACNPEDEFPLFFTRAIEGHWHSSDPVVATPDWGAAHSAYNNIAINDSINKIDHALSLAKSAFSHYTQILGIELDAQSQQSFDMAFQHQTTAFYRMRGGNLDAFISEMQNALLYYEQVSLEPLTDIYFDDFESENLSWSHGGNGDEWEAGAPTYGPANTYSGDQCWGTDLDNTYENGASNWLRSPWIELSNLNSAFLSFWIWNRVDDIHFYNSDGLWLDISTNGSDFVPLCSRIIGGHDDTAIPDVPGWNRVILDLTKYVGKSVTFRFRFESDETLVQPGTYIDDVHVYGRTKTSVALREQQAVQPRSFFLQQNFPNPFNSQTRIEYELFETGIVKLVVVNQIGEEVALLENRIKNAGRHVALWKPSIDISSGVYIYSLRTNHGSLVKKCLFLK